MLIVFKYPFLHFPSRSIDYHVQFSTVIYNFGYRRRIANRSGELRHEEFSHCYIHESVGREKFKFELFDVFVDFLKSDFSKTK